MQPTGVRPSAPSTQLEEQIRLPRVDCRAFHWRPVRRAFQVYPRRGGPLFGLALWDDPVGMIRGEFSTETVTDRRGQRLPHSLQTARFTSSATGRSAPY